MLIVLVDVFVKPDCVALFRQATSKNAAASRAEAGIARFDVLQDLLDETHFQLLEYYRTSDAPAAHKETEHYKTWRQDVDEMMAKPRASAKFTKVFPDDDS